MAGRKLIQEALPVWVIPPANYTGAAIAGDYISMKGYQSVLFVITLGAWAAGTAAITVNEATDVAATGAQALAFTEYWTNAAAIASSHMVRTACVNTFNIGVANALYALEITADSLTTNTAYDCISLAGATPGANNDYYSACAIGFRARYQGDLNEVIDAIID